MISPKRLSAVKGPQDTKATAADPVNWEYSKRKWARSRFVLLPMARLRGLIASLGSGPSPAFAGSVPGALTPIANTPAIAHSVDAFALAGIEIIDIAAPAELVDMFVAEASRHRPSGVQFRETVLDPDDAQRTILEWIASVPEATCMILESTAVGSDDLSPHLHSVNERQTDAIILECPPSPGVNPTGAKGGSISGITSSPEALEIGFLLGPAAIKHLGSPPLAGSISDGLDRFATHGGNVSRAMLQSWCKITGSASALLAGNRLKLDELVGNAASDSHPDCLVEGRVRIHGSAAVRSSRLRGPLVIGPGARIADSYIGPYTSIGAGCQIDGSEIENSILMTGARVHYFGHRIEDSVVGERTSLSSEFRIPSGFSLVVGPACEVTASV